MPLEQSLMTVFIIENVAQGVLQKHMACLWQFLIETAYLLHVNVAEMEKDVFQLLATSYIRQTIQLVR